MIMSFIMRGMRRVDGAEDPTCCLGRCTGYRPCPRSELARRLSRHRASILSRFSTSSSSPSDGKHGSPLNLKWRSMSPKRAACSAASPLEVWYGSQYLLTTANSTPLSVAAATAARHRPCAVPANCGDSCQPGSREHAALGSKAECINSVL